MKGENEAILHEIRDLLQSIVESQNKLLKEICELKVEQKKLKDEIKLSNFVLNNIAMRNEILN